MDYGVPSQPASFIRRPFFKKGGLVLCVLLFVIWGISSRYSLDYIRYDEKGSKYFNVSAGQVGVLLINQQTGPSWRKRFPPGWVFKRFRGGPLYGLVLPRVFDGDSRDTNFRLPLWLPFILVALPTFQLWRLDARVHWRCCKKCKYNLTGNTSGICPECGTPISEKTKQRLASEEPGRTEARPSDSPKE